MTKGHTTAKTFQQLYRVAATPTDELRFKRAAASFWGAMARRTPGWIQSGGAADVRMDISLALDKAVTGAWNATDVAILLDLAPADVDFQVKASIGRIVSSEFDDVCEL